MKNSIRNYNVIDGNGFKFLQTDVGLRATGVCEGGRIGVRVWEEVTESLGPTPLRTGPSFPSYITPWFLSH